MPRFPISSFYMPKKKITPISYGAFLNEKEIDCALSLRRCSLKFKNDLPGLAEHIGVTLVVPDEWCGINRTVNGFVFRDQIWLRLVDEFTNLITFAEEFYLLRFAPNAYLNTLGKHQIAYWKGKSRAFASIVMLEKLQNIETVEDIFRFFGPVFRTHALARYHHFKKHNW